MEPRRRNQDARLEHVDESAARGEITQALRELEAGLAGADERLLSLVYDHLRQIAKGSLRRERFGHGLDPSDLVHEAYLQLFKDQPPPLRDRGHLHATFARAVRQVLVDHARARASAKRGGDRQRVTLSGIPARGGSVVDILVLDEALDRLREQSGRHAQIVELRCFAGLTVPEVAEVLGIGKTTVDREWSAAKAWLLAELSG